MRMMRPARSTVWWARSEQAVLAINRDHNITDMPTIVEHVQDAVGKIEMLFKNKGSTTGVETGFTDLDK